MTFGMNKDERAFIFTFATMFRNKKIHLVKHFLKDEIVIQKIMAALTEGEPKNLLEVGPGVERSPNTWLSYRIFILKL
jgi:hypothetical protein